MRYKSRTRAFVGAATAAALALSGLALTASPAAANHRPVDAEGDAVNRIGGLNRYDTAAQLMDALLLDDTPQVTNDTVLIAGGEGLPDALGGSGLAGASQAGYLLVQGPDNGDAIPADTAAALTDGDFTNAVILGGTAAVSAAVEAELAATYGLNVSRLAGDNRFETAAAVNAELGAAPDIDLGAGALATGFLANGSSLVDALAISPGANKLATPVMLTQADTLSADAQATIDALGIEQIGILGGTSAVSQDIEDALDAAGINVLRLAGVNRYETAAAVADFHLDEAGFDTRWCFLAGGATGLIDALAGGPYANSFNGPLLLSQPTALGDASTEWFTENGCQDIIAIGGTAAVPDSVLAEAAALEVTPAATPGGNVVATDNVDDYTFGDTVSGMSVNVVFDADDTFVIDGQPSSLALFAAALSVGDTVTFADDTSATDADVHTLTNVDVADIDSGVVGNFNTGTDNAFDIIDPVTGTALRALDYTGGALSVDGATVAEAAFEAAVNEGDSIVIDEDAATFALTNATVSGTVATVGATSLSLVDGIGDNPKTATDNVFEAAGATTNTYTLNGEGVLEAAFFAAADAGDTASYARSGDAAVWTLTDAAPVDASFAGNTALEGTATNVADDTGVIAYYTDSDTGTIDFAVEMPDVFLVDGVASTETEFETAVDAGIAFGDAIAYDGSTLSITTSPNTEALPIAGIVLGNVGVADDLANETLDMVNAAGDLVADNISTGAAVGTTTARYFINGGEVSYSDYEDLLFDLADDANLDGETFQIVVGALSTEHRLTTDNAV